MTARPAPTQEEVSQINILQLQFQVLIDKHKGSQRAYQNLVSMSSQLDTQVNENTMVKEELELIKNDDAVVYKLSGPILIRQSLMEAKENVERRIKYIESELGKNKDLLEKAKEKLNEEKTSIAQLEEQIQKMMLQVGMITS